MAGRRYVYILEEHIAYEGEIFRGCFSTYLKAEAEKNRLLGQHMHDPILSKCIAPLLLIRKEVIQ